MRRPLIAGNWKMNETISEALMLVKELKGLVKDVNGIDIIIFPPFTALNEVSEEINGSNLACGGQNISSEQSGAFTGEISPPMIKENCEYVIIGHSERRHIFHEDNELINKKVKIAIKDGLKPILCVGELLEQRESGDTNNVIERQIRTGLADVSRDDILKVTIAYEPVWAIGTGKTATPEQAEEVHLFIRNLLKDMYAEGVSQTVRILYGGSVKPENIKELMSKEDIDGALVGGASLSAESFAKIVKYDG